MKIIENKVLLGTSGREFSFDLYLPDSSDMKFHPCLIFAHGFKGFKDWGHWYKIAEKFAESGYAFLKFNFSHNGVTAEHPTDFCDFDAFGNNNFSKELADTENVITWLYKNAENYFIDKHKIVMVGHSRGGPIAILTAAKDNRIAALITWASVSELNYAWQNSVFIKEWKSKGEIITTNARTGQKLPMYYQLYEDFEKHAAEFSVKNALKNFSKPFFILQGTDDIAIEPDSGDYLKKHASTARLQMIEGADHVFGGQHPFPKDKELPYHSVLLIQHCIDFLKENRI
jgi:acetyl esterase/lipase